MMSYLSIICMKLLKSNLLFYNPKNSRYSREWGKSRDFLLEHDWKLYSCTCMKHKFPGNTLYPYLYGYHESFAPIGYIYDI